MEVKKEGRYIVFKKDDGELAKFDLGENQCYRFYNGKLRPVKQLNNFFKGVDADVIINSLKENNIAYKKFINSIVSQESQCSNMGTFLNRLHKYAHLENWFLLNIEIDSGIRTKTSQYPKDILRIFQKQEAVFTRYFEGNVREYGDLILNMLRYIDSEYGQYKDEFNFVVDNILYYSSYSLEKFYNLVTKFNYNYRRLIDYVFWHIPRYEGINAITATSLLHDYANSKTLMGVKFDKYPKFLRSTHDITALAFNKFKEDYEDEVFEKTIDTQYNGRYNGYIIRCAESADEVKNEGAQLSHCVASYIEDIIMGKSLILFMRKEKKACDSLITIEVRNGMVVQARGYLNCSPTEEQWKVIYKWAKEKGLKLLNMEEY